MASFTPIPRSLASAAAAGALAVLALAGASGATGAPPAAGGEPAFVPGELLVGFEPGTGTGVRRAARAAGEAKLEERLAAPGLELVELRRGESVHAAARALERQPGVRYAEPNYYREQLLAPNDPRFDQLWGLENSGQPVRGATGTPGADIDAEGAWDIETGSASVAVAVVDDGVDHGHADLAPNVWRNPGETGAGKEANGIDDDVNGRIDDWRGWDFVDDDNDPKPNGQYHGTHVGGTIGASGDNGVGVAGVSWDVSLMPARVFGTDGRTTISRLVNAYDYARWSGASVLNGSYGGGGHSVTERNAIARSPEILFVFAAGNSSNDNDASPDYPCSYPLDNVVCVAATDQRDRLASFSSHGAQSVDLAAPGVSVVSTFPGNDYRALDGTSMATPHVAGAAALLRAARPQASVAELRGWLLDGVDPLPTLAGKVASDGRLDAHRSLAMASGEEIPTADSDVAAPDTTAPRTRVLRRPPRRTTARRAVFRVRATEPGSRFKCRFDRRPWRKCGKLKRYRRVGYGRHIFRVRAIDAAGNVQRPPARRAWRVLR